MSQQPKNVGQFLFEVYDEVLDQFPGLKEFVARELVLAFSIIVGFYKNCDGSGPFFFQLIKNRLEAFLTSALACKDPSLLIKELKRKPKLCNLGSDEVLFCILILMIQITRRQYQGRDAYQGTKLWDDIERWIHENPTF